MHFILLSGGSGKRLWPLSNDVRSKQFIKIFRNEEGDYESMVQRVYRQIKQADPDADITIATSKTQVSAIRNQLGEDVSVCIEPCRRDTFPAIALAAAFLRDEKKLSPDEAVVVCPVDPFVDIEYFHTLVKMCTHAQGGEANLVLMGIEPTYPSEKYGYIIPKTREAVSGVDCFREKPDAKTAAEYISQGALWNGGVFAFRLGYLLSTAEKLLGTPCYRELYASYEKLQKISFDYAVVEKESNIAVLRYNGRWADLGTWNTLTEAMEENTVGDVRLNETCENVHVLNDLNMPVLCMGLKNVIVSASPEGILVSDKEQSSYIKPYVDAIHQQVMFAEKSWGSFKVLDVGKDSLTIKITLLPGHRLHYHSHERREETWTVVSGEGTVVADDVEIPVKPGSFVPLPVGCRHTVIASTAMELIEVQVGSEISAADKIKYSLEQRYGKHR